MSTSSSKVPSKTTSRKQKNSQGEDDTQRKGPAFTSQLQSVDRFPEGVEDAPNRETGHGSGPSTSTLSLQNSKREDNNPEKRKYSTVSQLQPVGDSRLREDEGDRDARSRKARDNKPGILVASATVGRSSKEAGDRDNQDALSIATESDRGRRGATSFFQEASSASSDQIPPAHYHRVHTGGGAHISAAHFAGGNHTFGANSPQVIHNITHNNELKKTLLLPRVDAGFNDYPTKKRCGQCFEGTRVALLREIEDWITGPSESKMYILSGLAGIGKSTVAYTVASWAAGHNHLGASFFFSRNEVDRSNARKFFTTIAYQLCVYDKSFAEAIGNVLMTESGSAATTKDPQEQLQALIVDPLCTLVQSRAQPILVIVDALDECEEEDSLLVLTGLSQLVQNLLSFRVVLTTRPHLHLDRLFSSWKGHKIFHLHNIEDKIVDSDIQLYLKYCLSLEQVQKRFPKWQWCASDEEIDSLVQAAGRLFIIASTAVRYILDRIACNPATQMQKLLGANRTHFKDLNGFYTVILRSIVPAMECDEDIVGRYRSVVGTIIFVQHPLPVTTLAQLIDISVEELRTMLDHLQSVIVLGEDDIPRIYHKSFPDYITDSKCCQDVNLCIDPRDSQTHITIRSFQIMEQHLEDNILGLSGPAQYMSNEDALVKDGIRNEQLEEKIPEHLQYSCVYWANHLEIANIDNENLMKELERFANQRMLPWFEVLSLIRKLDLAYRAILVTLKVSKSMSLDSRQLLSDGLRFIGKFYEIIRQSARHTYHSALSFTPTDTLLYRRYINKGICQVIGGPDKWDALITTVNNGKWVRNVQFSLDSTMFVSWPENMLKIWDAVTGTPISESTFRGSHLAIANDFSTVASVKDQTITLYNANDSEGGATFTAQATIFGIAISSEGSRIAAGLRPGLLCLWDTENGELIECFNGYWDYLKFSATGLRLAYRSAKSIVTVRDGIDGRLIANLDCELEDEDKNIPDIVFSRDGSRIAMLSSAGLKLWSCDGELLGVAVRVAGYSPLAISADGSFLATRGQLQKVKLWGGNSSDSLRLTLPLVAVLDIDPESIVFSGAADTLLAIATESNIHLYNVSSRYFISTLPFSRFTALALSPDCSRLAAGNSDGTIYLWDIRGVQASGPSSDEPSSNQVTALALSWNNSRVACGFEDGAVELWEVDGLTKRRIAAHRNHKEKVTALGFSPDGSRFASGSCYGTFNLWDGRGGAPFETLKHPTSWLRAMELSNSVLAAVGDNGIVLWDSKTPDHNHDFTGDFRKPLSFSAHGALLAAVTYHTATRKIIVFDVSKRTTVTIFDIPGQNIRAMAFLPNNSQLIVQLDDDDINLNNDNFLAVALKPVNKEDLQRLRFEDIIQLFKLPVWNGVPVQLCVEHGGQCYLRVLFPQHNEPVNVLWISNEFHVKRRVWAKGRSMIVLGCEDGRVILLRLPTRHVT